MKLRIRTAAALVALPLVLGACGGGDQPTASSTTAASSAATSAGQSGTDPFSAQPGATVDPAAFLQGTQQAMQAKKTYAMKMNMAASGQTIKLDGVGDAADPNNVKVKMTMQAPNQGGAQGAIEMIMDGQNMYMKMPGQAGGKYVKISMEQLSKAGGQDFSKLMNPSENLKMSQQAVKSITFVGDEDVSGTKLKHYKVAIDPAKLQPTPKPTASGSPSSSPSTSAPAVSYDVWVDGEKLMRKMTMDQSGTKIDMTIDKYGEPVSIQAPPAAQVTQMPTQAPTATPTTK